MIVSFAAVFSLGLGEERCVTSLRTTGKETTLQTLGRGLGKFCHDTARILSLKTLSREGKVPFYFWHEEVFLRNKIDSRKARLRVLAFQTMNLIGLHS